VQGDLALLEYSENLQDFLSKYLEIIRYIEKSKLDLECQTFSLAFQITPDIMALMLCLVLTEQQMRGAS
jgi:hypothetical protein